jgi:uncharacterized membrane protein YhaH (DUF805 family)|tara:strand:- start:595 stop:972 length:378 start_codon:yes stop_codon:yes gene_type:complete
MSAFEWFLGPIRKYRDFAGRADRREYWLFIAWHLAFVIVLGVLSSDLYMLYVLGTLVPGIAVAVRRLHDSNRSGWWLLVTFVPIVGFIALIVFLASAGTSGPNDYGSEPGADPGHEDIVDPGPLG